MPRESSLRVFSYRLWNKPGLHQSPWLHPLGRVTESVKAAYIRWRRSLPVALTIDQISHCVHRQLLLHICTA